MRLLIDGYNLLYTAGIAGYGFGIGALERSRLGLLRFLAEMLEAEECVHTTVVFDAHGAPPGLPRTFEYHGITVRFAAKYVNADALIIELIEAATSPRQLTVVSSDHEIQRAARRRRAVAVDSDAWHDQLVRRQTQRQQTQPEAPAKPAPSLIAADVARWMETFGGEALFEEVAKEVEAESVPPATGQASAAKMSSGGMSPAEEPADEKGLLAPLDNPFPPGYGEDLEE